MLFAHPRRKAVARYIRVARQNRSLRLLLFLILLHYSWWCAEEALRAQHTAGNLIEECFVCCGFPRVGLLLNCCHSQKVFNIIFLYNLCPIMTLPRTTSPLPASSAAASSKPKPSRQLHPSAVQKFLAAEARLSAWDDAARALSSLKKARVALGKASTKTNPAAPFQRRLYRRKNYPAKVRENLLEWMRRHLNHPYPSDQEKAELAQQTGLDTDAVSTWFTNARVRYLPGLKEEAMRGSGGSIISGSLAKASVVVPSRDAVRNHKKRRVV